MGEGERYPILHVKQVKHRALVCKNYSAGSLTRFCGFALWSHRFSLHALTVSTYFTIIYAYDPQTCKPKLPILSKPFSMIIFGFVIFKNVSTSEPFGQDLATILDSSKSLADQIHQVNLAAHIFLLYSNNCIKAEQNGGEFRVVPAPDDKN